VLLHCLAKRGNTAWFLQFFWLTIHTHAAVWLPKSLINTFSSGLLGGTVQEKRSRERCSSWDCVARTVNAPVRCLLGFLFRKVMLNHWIVDVGKQSIIWFLTSAKSYRNRTVYVKIIANAFLSHGVLFTIHHVLKTSHLWFAIILKYTVRLR